MTIWTVHARGAGEPVLVREGFSPWAFLFAAPWFALKRMWLVLVLYLAGSAILGVALAPLPEALAGACAVAVQLLIGWHARDLERWTLARKGFRMIGVVAARGGEDEAYARLYAARPELLAWARAA
ncbi:DUF2628 domain-containing protein [Elioraea tepida]|jgi:hypothetical protein|uniref:DUF2628 domain-containing protein n=1 Tax=Elioraea tepida TaxID=2843330 RepID=A0A975YKU1_9PROT|nr:DUF2628 domain-containing protein [Elioraea tepida]QXM26096.1 DUF2628 domain-containing protein [Elioraea tepida]